jgi:hypothetical protein
VLERNRRGAYTVPAVGLYPYQWCWDSGPIALGWAAAGEWDQAWSELTTLMRAQWPTGFVPHIVFWEETDDYFPGPDVWGTAAQGADGAPATTGITQPPLPVSAAARLFTGDPDRARAAERMRALWDPLVAWLEWIGRARRGPHGAAVVVHPWESGMDNSPSWDEPLAAAPEVSHRHLDRRDVMTVSATQRPTTTEYRRYIGIVVALRDAGWDTEHQIDAGPFAVEDPGFTAVAARAADDLAVVAGDVGRDPEPLARLASRLRDGLAALWDDDAGGHRAHDLRTGRAVGPLTSGHAVAVWAGCDALRTRAIADLVERWTAAAGHGVPTTDPASPAFDPLRYWRGPVWVLVNWMVADGLARAGIADVAESLRASTLALVAREGFCEYFDPRDGTGIGGQGFSWTAALTLAWLDP